jgi:probable phosphoglycerate mutase
VGDGTLRIVQDRDLSELHPGEADGLGWQEVVDRFGVPEWDTDPDMLIAPGGESWSGFVVRASSAVRELAERHPGELVVAAVHAGVIESSMIANLAIPPTTSRRGWTRVVHASLTEWEWVAAQSRWVLIRFNDACGVPTE